MPSSWAEDSCYCTLCDLSARTLAEPVCLSAYLSVCHLSVRFRYGQHAADRDAKGTLSVGLSAGGRTRLQHTVNRLQGRWKPVSRLTCAGPSRSVITHTRTSLTLNEEEEEVPRCSASLTGPAGAVLRTSQTVLSNSWQLKVPAQFSESVQPADHQRH